MFAGVVWPGVVGFEKKHMGRVQGTSPEDIELDLTNHKIHPFEGVGVSVEGCGLVRSQFRLHRSKEHKKLGRLTKNLDFPST